MEAFIASFLKNTYKQLGYQKKDLDGFIEIQMYDEKDRCVNAIINRLPRISGASESCKSKTIDRMIAKIENAKKLGYLLDELKELEQYLSSLPESAIDKETEKEYLERIQNKVNEDDFQIQFSKGSLDAILKLNLEGRTSSKLVIDSRMTKFIARYWVVPMVKKQGAKNKFINSLNGWGIYFSAKGKRLNCFSSEEDVNNFFTQHIGPILQRYDLERITDEELISLVAQILDKLEEISQQQKQDSSLINEKEEILFDKNLMKEFTFLKEKLELLTLNAEGSNLLMDKDINNIRLNICNDVMEDYRFYTELHPKTSMEEFINSKQGMALMIYRMYQSYPLDSDLIKKEWETLQKYVETETSISVAKGAQIKTPALIEEQVTIGKDCIINSRCIICRGTRIAQEPNKMVMVGKDVCIGRNCIVDGVCNIGRNCIIEDECTIKENIANFTYVDKTSTKSILQADYCEYIRKKFMEEN